MKINIRGCWSLKSLWASWQSLLSLPWTFQVRDKFLNESWSWESAIATPSHCNTWNLSRWAAEKCKVTDTGFVSRIFMPYLQSYHILSYHIVSNLMLFQIQQHRPARPPAPLAPTRTPTLNLVSRVQGNKLTIIIKTSEPTSAAQSPKTVFRLRRRRRRRRNQPHYFGYLGNEEVDYLNTLPEEASGTFWVVDHDA